MNTKGLILHAIEWLDAHYKSDEVSIDEIKHEPYRFVTVGILLRSDEKGITVAAEIAEDGRYRGTNFIPRGMIVDDYPLGHLVKHRQRKPKHIPLISPS